MEKKSKNEMKHVEVKAGRTIQTPSNTLKPKIDSNQESKKSK
jgi:hypothetical protein